MKVTIFMFEGRLSRHTSVKDWGERVVWCFHNAGRKEGTGWHGVEESSGDKKDN